MRLHATCSHEEGLGSQARRRGVLWFPHRARRNSIVEGDAIGVGAGRACHVGAEADDVLYLAEGQVIKFGKTLQVEHVAGIRLSIHDNTSSQH